MAGQSISDRITAAQHTFIGSDMSKIVCKASTHEIMGPKKKHLDYLTALTREQNINIPELADLLIERTKIQSWVVVFKTLISTHHLMCYGNERFIQHLASRQALFNLANFIDKTGVQGYDMSTFVRRYARYLNQKAVSYRTVAYDFTRAKRGKDDGVLRSLSTDDLLKTIPTLQHQLDVLLEFQASSNELINGVVNCAFMLLFKDLIRLFACYNDGIVNLLEKFFDMKKQHCKDALELYRRFLTRMEKVAEFLKVAEQVGIDKGDIPDLTQAPNSLLDALEQHYANLDGKKGLAKPSKTISAQVKEFSTVNATFDTKDKEASLMEEEERLRLYKLKAEEQHHHVSTPAPAAAPVSQQQPPSNIDWLSSDLAAPASNSTSLFDVDFSTQPTTAAFPPPQQNAFSQQPFGMQPFSQPAMTSNQMFPPMTNQAPTMASSEPNLFNTSSSLDTSAPFQGDLLTPTIYGQPISQGTPGNSYQVGKDLDSSLASVVANLNVGVEKANQNFLPTTERQLTGGMNFQPQPTNPMTMQPTMTMQVPGYQPGMMGQTRTMYGQPMYGQPMQQYGQPMQPYGQPMMGAQPGMRPGMYGQPMGMQPQMNVRQMNPNNPFEPTIQF